MLNDAIFSHLEEKYLRFPEDIIDDVFENESDYKVDTEEDEEEEEESE